MFASLKEFQKCVVNFGDHGINNNGRISHTCIVRDNS